MSEKKATNEIADKVLEFFADRYQSIEFQREEMKGGVILFGAFPSIIITMGIEGAVDGYIVSLNADPSLIADIAFNLAKEFPYLPPCGPFVEKIDGNGIIVSGEELFDEYERHIMSQSIMIAKKYGDKTQEDNVKEKESKSSGIILPPSGLTVR